MDQGNEFPSKSPLGGDAASNKSSDLTRTHIWQVQAFRDLLIVAVIVTVIWAGYALRFVTVPLLLAFALAYLVEPLVRWICRTLRISRPVAVSSILGTFGLTLVVGGVLFVPIILRQTDAFVTSAKAGHFDQWIDRFQDVLPQEYRDEVSRVRGWLEGEGTAKSAESSEQGRDPETVWAPPVLAPKNDESSQRGVDHSSEQIAAPVQRENSITKSLLSPAAQSAVWKLLDFSSLLFAAVLIPFYFWFFSVGFPGALAFIGGLIPTSRKARVFQLAAEMDAAVAGFVRGRILIAAGMGVMFAGGWWINGVPYALTLGLLAGVLSIVPYLGIVVVIPAIALNGAGQLAVPEAERMAWYWIIGGPPLVFVVVQSIEGYLLTPIFAGRATNLGPVSIFVAVLAGASVAGLYGMLLAIPVAACTKILIRETVMPSLRSWAAGKSVDPLPIDRG